MLYLAATEAAAESSGLGSLFEALGINWQGLILNGLAFLGIVWILGKYVYPHLIKALDNKKGELEAATRLEHEARSALDKANETAGNVVTEARTAADQILASAKADAEAQIEAARKKATEQSERLVAEAREQLARDVAAARRDLKADTAKLVASATEAVLGEKLDSHRDGDLIKRSLEVKR
jgi:F-type H+-transporting ATPase subunit b